MNTCTPKKKSECMANNSPEILELLCQKCEYSSEDFEPSMWFQHILNLYTLQRAGYPFSKNDLTLDEWRAMGSLRRAFEVKEWQMKATLS